MDVAHATQRNADVLRTTLAVSADTVQLEISRPHNVSFRRKGQGPANRPTVMDAGVRNANKQAKRPSSKTKQRACKR